MGLLDWLRGGGQKGPRDTQEERMQARPESAEGGESYPQTPEDIEEAAQQRRDEEAMRHTGL